jgi:hypothetical protein
MTHHAYSDGNIWSQFEAEVSGLLQWAEASALADRADHLRKEIALSNNGWVATHDLEAANLLKQEGFVLRTNPLAAFPKYAIYGAAAQLALAKCPHNVSSTSQAIHDETDYEALILNRQERQITDF